MLNDDILYQIIRHVSYGSIHDILVLKHVSPRFKHLVETSTGLFQWYLKNWRVPKVSEKPYTQFLANYQRFCQDCSKKLYSDKAQWNHDRSFRCFECRFRISSVLDLRALNLDIRHTMCKAHVEYCLQIPKRVLNLMQCERVISRQRPLVLYDQWSIKLGFYVVHGNPIRVIPVPSLEECRNEFYYKHCGAMHHTDESVRVVLTKVGLIEADTLSQKRLMYLFKRGYMPETIFLMEMVKTESPL